MKLTALLLLALCGCVSQRQGRPLPAPTANAGQETSVQALAAVVAQLDAKLDAEINGLKVQGDLKGLEYNSVYPIGVAASQTFMQLVLAALVWRIVKMVELVTRLSHDRELKRLSGLGEKLTDQQIPLRERRDLL